MNLPPERFKQQTRTMLTLFTIPKAFKGRTAMLQQNAIRSWQHVLEGCEIFLCGDDAGVAATAEELRVRHLADIRRNTYGTPLLNDAFSKVARMAREDTLVYLNSDIILLSSLNKAMERMHFTTFLISGERHSTDVTSPIDFTTSSWRESLLDAIHTQGQRDGPDALDYFVFPRATCWVMPDFAVGRPGWDNWMIYQARTLNVPVIDATECVTIVHQNHDYTHVACATGSQWQGPEGNRNIVLAGGREKLFTLADATHQLSSRGLQRIPKTRRLHRELDILTTRRPVLAPAYKLAHAAVTCGEHLAAWLGCDGPKESND